MAVGQRVADVALAAEPLEPLREQRDDVELHQRRGASLGDAWRARRAQPARLAQEGQIDVDDARGDVHRAHRVAHERHEQVRRAGALDLERLARGQRHHAQHAADLDGPVDHAAALEVLGVPLVLAERRRDAAMHEQVQAAQRLGRLAAVVAGQAQDRALVGAGAAHDLRLAAADAHGGAQRQQRAARARHVEGAVEPVGPADAARREPLDGRPRPRQSTMSTSTRRFSLTAAALTTVRRALAVRPPRPMILP